MQQFRKNKFTWATLLFLFAGLAAHFMGQNQAARQNDALTEWLLSFANDQQSDLALHKIRSIDRQSAGFQEVIAQASEIMVQHPDLFSIPSDANSNQDDVRQVLLVQWNLHNQASGMSGGAQIERTRSVASNPYDTQSKNWYSGKVPVIRMAIKMLPSVIADTENRFTPFYKSLYFSIFRNAP